MNRSLSHPESAPNFPVQYTDANVLRQFRQGLRPREIAKLKGLTIPQVLSIIKREADRQDQYPPITS
jgi:hypothetical protein